MSTRTPHPTRPPGTTVAPSRRPRLLATVATAAAAVTALAATPETSPFLDDAPPVEPDWAVSVEGAVDAGTQQLRVDAMAHAARVEAAAATDPVEAPAPEPAPEPAEPAPAPPEPAPTAEPARSIWDRLADCESGNWSGDGTPVPGTATWAYAGGYFEGGLQFDPRTWDAFRDPAMPAHAGNATRGQQIAVAERVQAAQGWGAWPVCSRKIGLR